MKEKVMTEFEKFFLAQRAIIEMIIDQLKALCQIDHRRHTKPDNFLVNLVSELMAYMLKPRKPTIQMPKKLKNISLLMSSWDYLAERLSAIILIAGSALFGLEKTTADAGEEIVRTAAKLVISITIAHFRHSLIKWRHTVFRKI